MQVELCSIVLTQTLLDHQHIPEEGLGRLQKKLEEVGFDVICTNTFYIFSSSENVARESKWVKLNEAIISIEKCNN